MMPKSTATMRPSSSTNRFPGCMSAWKKPSRIAWRRKVWITARAELRQVEALGAAARRMIRQRGAVDPFQRQHVLGGAVPVDRRHAEIRIVLGVLRHLRQARRLRAADPFRAPPSGASVSAVSTRRSRRASADRLSAFSRGEGEGVLIEPEAPLDAGPQHLHRDRLQTVRRSSPARDAPARSRRRPPRCRTRQRPRRAAGRRRAPTVSTASACGNGGIRSCRLSRSRAIGDADHVRPRRQELPELHIGRAEPRQRRGEPCRPGCPCSAARSAARAASRRAPEAAAGSDRPGRARLRARTRNRRAPAGRDG